MKIVAAFAVSIATVGLTWIGVAPASAHTPVISADCNGVHVQATAYEANKQNRWSVTIGGVTQSGTFGASFNQTFAVPQNGATTSWSANVSAQDGGYPGQGAGSVGPCGTPPPPTDVCENLPGNQPAGTSCTPPPDATRADNKALEGCDVAFGGTTYGAGELTYDEQYTDTHVFNETTNTWDLVTDTTATIVNTEFTPWSVQEQVANGCTEPTTQPPDVIREDSKALEGCDVSLDGTTYGAGELTYDEQYTDTHVYNETTNTWDLVTDTTATIVNTEFTPWSVQEQVANGCSETTTQPPPIVSSESTSEVVCGDDVVVTTTVETTTAYVYDAETNEWVLGEPQVHTTTSESPVEAGVCDETGVLPNVDETDTTEVVHVVKSPEPAQAQVPIYVNAGLAGPATAAIAPSGGTPMPALLLLMGSALALVGGLRLRRS